MLGDRGGNAPDSDDAAQEVAGTPYRGPLHLAPGEGRHPRGGSPKAALVVRDGPGSEGAGGDGWYVESWAVCDVVELPDVARELGCEVWTDARGEPVPTRVLAVTRGPEHCAGRT